MANINLAPGTQYMMLVRKRRMKLFAISGALLVLMFVAWASMTAVRGNLQSRADLVEDRIRAAEMSISELGEDGRRVLLFENRLLALDGLLDNHVSWNPLLGDLERLLPPQTVLKSVNANLETGTISIAGETSDMDLAAQTLASLNSRPDRDTLFTGGSISGISQLAARGEGEPDRVEFNATFSFDKARLSNK